jgi:3-hydroxyanthranilate 3,4-dioxygenase
VGNKVVWQDGDYIVMVVGGPNSRKDYHYNETPEFFHQIEGDMVLKIMNNGIPEDVHINEGDIYLLPPKVPHSPQRSANTIGLVIEYPRPDGMMDALEWYCENCNDLLYREEFALDNIETDMPSIFDKYYGDKEKRSCTKCGNTMEPPK